MQRYTYYERQLGKKADEIEKAIPELGELDKDSLDKMKFAMKEPEVALREIEVDIATGPRRIGRQDRSAAHELAGDRRSLQRRAI